MFGCDYSQLTRNIQLSNIYILREVKVVEGYAQKIRLLENFIHRQ